ncbi:MAG: nuclear transport factor 2 family protein, partial [bacterium]|nr:nuclear transport factor 2 family protein [bacterium]
MAREVSVWTVVVLLLVGVGITGAGDTNETLANTVRETEIAFAKTMADRDHAAFAAFLTAETVFLSGSTEFRGKDAVAAAWKPFFVGSNAPFSWQPETVSVLDSGTLGLSSGPVFDP